MKDNKINKIGLKFNLKYKIKIQEYSKNNLVFYIHGISRLTLTTIGGGD